MTGSSAPKAFEMCATSDWVGVWSDVNVAFERAREETLFRDTVRSRVESLRRSPVLYASYATTETSYCRAEHNTIYDVGEEPFEGLGDEAVLIERIWDRGPDSPSGASLGHFVEYRALPAVVPWREWKRGRTLVMLHGEPVAWPVSVSSVWASLRKGVFELRSHWDRKSLLGLSVRVECEAPIRLVAHLRAILGGAIAAVSTHDGTERGLAAWSLAATLLESPLRTLNWIDDFRTAVLGARRLVQWNGDAVEWNVADESIAAISVTAGPESDLSPPARATRLTVELHTVERIARIRA